MNEWDAANIHRKVVIQIPDKIRYLFEFLDEKLNTEWCVFLKVKEVRDNRIVLDEEFFIPKQSVQYSHVEPLEEPPKGFNVVVHKHPPGIEKFSSVDWENLNANTKISLLWCSGRITDAAIQVDAAGVMTWLPYEKIQVVFRNDDISFPEDLLDRFIRKPEKPFMEPVKGYYDEIHLGPEDYVDMLVYEYLEEKGFPREVDTSEVARELGIPEEEVTESLKAYGYTL